MYTVILTLGTVGTTLYNILFSVLSRCKIFSEMTLRILDRRRYRSWRIRQGTRENQSLDVVGNEYLLLGYPLLDKFDHFRRLAFLVNTFHV